MSLRTALSTAMLLLSLVAMLAAGSLIGLTGYLHRVTAELRAGTESVRIFQEADIDLLLHSRAVDPLVRAELERELLDRMEAAEAFVTSEQERELMDEARRRVGAYLALDPVSGRAAGGPIEPALQALDALVRLNVAEARAAEAQAARWDRLGDALGMGMAALLLIGVAGALLWSQSFVFRPVLAIAAAMQRYVAGDRQAAAPEAGARELREIAHLFNEMSQSLGRQRERQMTFLAGVAHDLRNPLSALKLGLALVAPGRALPPEEKIRSMVALFGRQVDRLDRMAGDFLDIARIEAGVLDLKVERHDVRAPVLSALELFEASSPLHTWHAEVPDEPVMLEGDPARVEQVLNNLVSNAIKYSPSGGEIGIRLERQGGGALISVSDRGIGISREEQARVFEPFRRAAGSVSGIPGEGLGLFVARRVIEAHGGRIELESAPGKGSTFKVWLPEECRAVSAPAGAGSAPEAEEGAGV